MKLAYAVSALLLIFCLASKTNNAQSLEPDSSFHSMAISNAIQVYHHYLTPEPGLYNGSEYAGYPFRLTEGHQFFETNELVNGSIVYDGVLYENVPMQIDLITEHVIIKCFGGAYLMQLINEKISSFKLLDHTFIRITKDSANSNVISTGFYDRLYTGNLTVLKKEQKKIQENVSIITGITGSVTERNFYYLEKAAKFYNMKNKNSLLEVLHDKKKEIKQFIRKNKLKFKRDPDNVLIQIARYYDTLNNK
ncbi:MAG TPA: hypothetical protein VH396_11250 [Chitinophagaceae bacterium]|jgi:hypothetical protein